MLEILTNLQQQQQEHQQHQVALVDLWCDEKSSFTVKIRPFRKAKRHLKILRFDQLTGENNTSEREGREREHTPTIMMHTFIHTHRPTEEFKVKQQNRGESLFLG